MPYRLTPEDIVAMLEDRLQELGMIEQVPVEIKNKLEIIKEYYPKLKNLETTIVNEFKVLGSKISGDDVFTKTDDATKVNQWLKSIDETLIRIKEITETNKIEGKKVLMGQISFSQHRAEESESSRQLKFRFEERIRKSQAFSSLKVSFDKLDHQSRLCSLCLSVFPENAIIKKRPLIYWWIGEGFVRAKNGKVAEQVGDEIFKNLWRKGLVQAEYKGNNPIVDSCTIHPWVRKLLLAVQREAKFLDFGNLVWSEDPLYKRQRIGLVEETIESLPKTVNSIEETVVLFNVDKKNLQILSSILSHLKRVKVLQLGRWKRLPEHHIELEIIGDTKKPRDDTKETLINVEGMKQLKYLSLQGISRVSDLPDSINELLNLEILDLRACHNLGKLPSTIGSLHNLTHLDVTECYFLESMPKGIEKLLSLQVLKGFMLGTYNTNSCKLRDLSRLANLRKLSIYIRNKAHGIQEQVDLSGSECLRSLTITWGGGTWETEISRQTRGEGTSETEPSTKTIAIKLPELLEKLDLRCYPFATAPEWLSPGKLQKLKKLYIRGGLLNSLGDQESTYDGLEILRLKYLTNMEVYFKGYDNEVPIISINKKETKFRSLEYYQMARRKDNYGEEFELEDWTKVHNLRSFIKKKDQLTESGFG